MTDSVTIGEQTLPGLIGYSQIQAITSHNLAMQLPYNVIRDVKTYLVLCDKPSKSFRQRHLERNVTRDKILEA